MEGDAGHQTVTTVREQYSRSAIENGYMVHQAADLIGSEPGPGPRSVGSVEPSARCPRSGKCVGRILSSLFNLPASIEVLRFSYSIQRAVTLVCRVSIPPATAPAYSRPTPCSITRPARCSRWVHSARRSISICMPGVGFQRGLKIAHRTGVA